MSFGPPHAGPKLPSKSLREVVVDAVRLPTAPAANMRAWLAMHPDLEHLEPLLALHELEDLCRRLRMSRVGLLAHLKALGVQHLQDRQAIANRLGKDHREHRIVLPGEQLLPVLAPPPPPPPPPMPHVRSSGSAPERRAAAVNVDKDAVMVAIRDRRPSTAVQAALALADSAKAWILRGRAMVAMGSLESAARAYDAARRDADDIEAAALADAEKAALLPLALFVNALATARPLFFPRRAASGESRYAGVVHDGTYMTASPKTAACAAAASGCSADAGCIEIGYRLWECVPRPSSGRAPRAVLMYFHGNGEVASDYDAFAELYTLMGLHLLVVDFRGYGWSTDAPTLCSALLSDAEPLLLEGALETALRRSGLAAAVEGGLPLLLFGRSMGSNVAIHLAALQPRRIAALVIESGIASLSSLLAHAEDAEAEQQAYEAARTRLPRPGGGVEHVALMEHDDKLRECTMPTLILHGTADRIVPPAQARQAFRVSGAARKRLCLIEGAGHNDIAMADEYFRTIASFVDEALGTAPQRHGVGQGR